MELLKKNIHMDRICCKAGTQITLEDDRNIPDVKPDVNTLICEQGKVKIDEIKSSKDHVNVKGKLLYEVLYQTDEGEKVISTVEGEIPFDEQVYMEGVTDEDDIEITCFLEDLKANFINSRKVNLQSVVSMNLKNEESYEEETAVGLYHDEPVEYRVKPIEIAQLAIRKKDLFRVHKEIELPANFPNMVEVIFRTVKLRDVTFKSKEEGILVEGEIFFFMLYEGEGEETLVRAFENAIPFEYFIDCVGCKDKMIPNITYEISHLEVEIKPDADGEERKIGIEMVVDLKIHLYEEMSVQILSDVYGVTKEIEAKEREVEYKRILAKNNGKCKVAEHITLEESDLRMLQVLYGDGMVEIDEIQVVEKGLEIEGSLLIQVLYVTGEDHHPYGSMKRQIPFRYTLEVPGIQEDDLYNLNASCDQLSVNMLDSEALDVKAIVGLKGIVFRKENENVISEVVIEDLNQEKVNELPGMVVYIVQPGDSLWKIGKKYYISVETIKEMNHLSTDEIHPGDKLLLVKYLNGDG